MCLVKVRQEEDVVVPYRVASPRRTSRHYSRTQIVEEDHRRPIPSPRTSYHSTHVSTVIPSPRPNPIPAPQPVPVFINQPPTPPPPASSVGRHSTQYVHVSPASSVTSHSRTHSDYYVSEHEYRVERERHRERDHSRDRSRRRSRSRSSDRYHERPATYRYIDSRPLHDNRAEFTRTHSTRSRSRSRGAYDDDRDGRASSYGREKVVIVDDNGRRRREYL
ncbi:hypothetical protein EJ05DRAFT_475621, partial [Pseudovirgaria hyperparasitica]